MTSPSHSDLLVEESAEAAAEWPAEWPELIPAMKLPRNRRADVFDRYADLVEQLPTLRGSLTDEEDTDRPAANAGRAAWATYAGTLGVEVKKDMGRDEIISEVDEFAARRPSAVASQMRQIAALARIAGEILEAIEPAAADPSAFAVWAQGAPDMDIFNLFMRWAQRTQLGEATGSAS